MIADQPVGERILIGETGMKSAPGTHANQKVPTVVVPVLSSLMSYLKTPPPSGVAVIDAEAISVALAGLTDAVDSKAMNARVDSAIPKIRMQLIVSPHARRVKRSSVNCESVILARCRGAATAQLERWVIQERAIAGLDHA